MIKPGRRRAVDPASFRKYYGVATSLRKSATDISDLAADGDSYGNGLAIIAIHACIAYANALCVKFAGFKSAEGDHQRAVDTLQEAVGNRVGAAELRSFQRALSQKDQVSYRGDYYTISDARMVVNDMLAFADCAEKFLI